MRLYGRKANSGKLAVLVSHGHCVPKLDNARGFRDFESGMVGLGVGICKTGGCRVPWKSLSGAARSISHVACDLKWQEDSLVRLTGRIGANPSERGVLYVSP